MDANDLVVDAVEIIKDKLYFATLRGDLEPPPTKNNCYYHIEDDIVYESFFSDYGPYHLSHLYIFCHRLNSKLAKLPKTKKLFFYTSDNKIQRLNAAYLIGCYMIIYLKKLPEPTSLLLMDVDFELRVFRDASSGYPHYEISLRDVLSGLYKAFVQGFFNFKNFNYRDYLFYEKVVNGDLNWIIPEKMLAFSGPHFRSKYLNDYPVHSPESYHEYFKNNNVTAIVRLNQKSYNAKQFTDYGFEHHELFFLDGSVPTYTIVDKFIKLCENTKGAVAVHCKAGLGRTGTLIACYMMKHHDFLAREAISWLRICRPGSVIGYQQKFLIDIESKMLREGKNYRLKYNITKLPKFKYGIYSRTKNSNNEDLENGNCVESDAEKSNLEDEKNSPAVKPAACKTVKDSDITPAKKNKDEFVSLDSIINSNQTDSVGTRSSSKTRASTALVNAKNTYTANKNNYIMSNSSADAKYPTQDLAKVHPPATTAIVRGKTRGRVPYCHTKDAYTNDMKQFKIVNSCSQRMNLATTTARNLRGCPVSNNIRTPNTQDGVKNSTSMTINRKVYNGNLNKAPKFPLKRPTIGLPRSKMFPRKKLTNSTQMEQIKDFKKCNISNSESERDSTNTTPTNISADSLENIPCKMATRRDKSRSPEPTYPLGENVNKAVGDMEEGIDSQGTKLCLIKATRKKPVGYKSSAVKKEGVKTRNYTATSLAKKK